MEKLIVDKNHNKIDVSKIGKPLKKITSGLLAGGMALSMYSGALSNFKVSADELNKNNSIVSTDEDSKEINFGKNVLVEMEYEMGQFIVGDARKANSDLTLMFHDEDYDLSDMKYFENIKELNLYFCSPCNVFDSLDKMPVMPNVEKLFFMYGYNSELTDENIDKLREKFPNLKSLDLSDAVINPSFAEKMTGLEELSIRPSRNCDIDFTKLTYLKKLELGSLPYTTPIYFNTNEYNTLCTAGVEIEFGDLEDKDIYLDVSKKLDDIVSSLNISENSSDKEKLDAILIFVMENLEYDPVVSQAIENGKNPDMRSFYTNGLLDGVFNKNTAICGNYSALVEAIYDRVSPPEKSVFMYSDSHAWNLINIDGELYYVDSTWLDEESISNQIEETYIDDQGFKHTLTSYDYVSSIDAIKEGKTDTLEWYMNNNFDYDPVHHTSSIPFPEYVVSQVDDKSKNELEQTLEDEVNSNDDYQSEEKATVNENKKEKKVVLEDSSNKKVNINVNGKTIGISLGVLVGVLAGAGLAVHVTKKKKREKERRRQQLEELANENYFGYNSSYSSGSYNGNYSNSYGSSYTSGNSNYNNYYETGYNSYNGYGIKK